MSKARRHAREEREALATKQQATERARRERVLEHSRRRAGRQLGWRRNRLWQHGPAFRRDREKWAVLATLVLGCLLVAYLLTGSLRAIVLVALVSVIALPALAMLVFDRRSR